MMINDKVKDTELTIHNIVKQLLIGEKVAFSQIYIVMKLLRNSHVCNKCHFRVAMNLTILKIMKWVILFYPVLQNLYVYQMFLEALT